MTNHLPLIVNLRTEANLLRKKRFAKKRTRHQAVCLDFAADLLETHDRTGINITKWSHCEDFVYDQLAAAGMPDVEIQPNGA